VVLRSQLCGCFPGGTGVLTPHGLAAIASLHVGDLVLAEDPAAGKVEPEKVKAVIDDGLQPLMQVRLSDGSSLSVTTNHPFYVDGGPGIATPQWVSAGDLRLGDRIRTASGRDLVVTNLWDDVGSAHVYTLTIAVDHDFFVGTARVLVHNCVEELLGAKGTQMPSRTLLQLGPTERIDVENFDPGKIAGNIHYQDPNKVKYYYDPLTGTFKGLSKTANKKLLAKPGVRQAILKGLRFLGVK